MSLNGYLKIHRKLKNNPIVMKDADHLAVWMWLLIEAAWKEHPRMFGGNKIVLKPGQLITGRKQIATELSISESKVQRILNLFESDHQIEQQTTRYGRLISIVRWNEYQCDEQPTEQQVDNERTTSGQPVNTTEESKKGKKGKNVFIPPTIEEVREYFAKNDFVVDPDFFFSYYDSDNWMSKNRKGEPVPMKNWKQKAIVWNNKQKEKQPSRQSQSDLDSVLDDFGKGE